MTQTDYDKIKGKDFPNAWKRVAGDSNKIKGKQIDRLFKEIEHVS